MTALIINPPIFSLLLWREDGREAFKPKRHVQFKLNNHSVILLFNYLVNSILKMGDLHQWTIARPISAFYPYDSNYRDNKREDLKS